MSGRDFDAILEAGGEPLRDGDRPKAREDGDTGTSAEARAIFGAGQSGAEYERAVEDADFAALRGLDGEARRDPSGWGPEEQLARAAARRHAEVGEVERRTHRALQVAGLAYRAHNTAPWTLAPDAAARLKESVRLLWEAELRSVRARKALTSLMQQVERAGVA